MVSIDWVEDYVFLCPVALFVLEVDQWFVNAGNIIAACSSNDVDDVVVSA